MADPISLSALRSSPLPSPGPSRPSPGAGSAFASTLDSVMGKVDDTTAKANQAIQNMLNGTGDVHEALIALHEAEIALQTTVQMRNKLVQAYQDIMRMPV